MNKLETLHDMLVNHNKYFKDVDFNMGVFIVKRSCGTAACALGSAAIYPPFMEQGLTATLGGFVGDVEYEEWEDFTAGQMFFNITYREAEWLFDPKLYLDQYGDEFEDITPEIVATRVGALIDGSISISDDLPHWSDWSDSDLLKITTYGVPNV